MASFLCDLVKSYVEKLIDGAIAEARHVFCFTCIVKEFEEERARLEPERMTMQQRVKVAKERDKDIQANVGSWAEEIDKLNQVDTKTKQTCFFGFCPDCIWRYKNGKELANNLEKIKQLIEKGEKLENIELPRRLPDVERYSSKDYIPFKSRQSKYKELLDALTDDNNYITGLHGMGGTGKTTMAKEVGKELKQSEQFSYVVDTTVSFTPDIKKIQDDIAGSLGLKWEDSNESDRPKKLWNRLTNGEKILVILDDVWERHQPLNFDAIGIPKQGNHKGCRVLVTSRSKETFNKMDCDKIIELDLLSEEDAWIMFKMYAGICNRSSKKLIDKGRKIAKECKQLPVAISVIASSLKGQQHREHEWDVTLKSLKKPVSMHGVDEDMVGIYKCLKFSYDYLKDEKAKGLFLLCSVFQEDEENSIEVLTRLCIGVGLLGEDYGSYDDARNQVVVAKNKLVDSCLLLEVDKKRLKMHDLVRDAAQWIANKEIQCVKLFDKKQKSLVENLTNIKYLLCEGKFMDFFNMKFDGSKLETLIVKVDRDGYLECINVPNSFFENVIKLRVLNFSGNHYERSLSLPDSIRSLTNIRSMLVDKVDLGDISILGNLQSLETLDLVECKINELPNQITKLRKFKLLKLKGCEIRMNNPFEVIERCSSLEELYFKDSFNDFCQEITLPELQRYHINGRSNFDLERSSRFSKYVVFCGYECQFSKGTVKYCMQTAEALCLRGIITWGWRNLMPDIVPVELGMNDLVELQLSDMSQLQCLVDTIGSQAPNVLSKLVVLRLKEMENLEELSNGPLSFESLNNLESLSIKGCEHLRSLFKGKLNLCNLKSVTIDVCPMLVSLFEVSTFSSLVLLEKLEIENCKGLKTIIADERREDEEIGDGDDNNKSHGSIFSKLKVIHISGCSRFQSILPFLSAQDLPVLETIEITSCGGLKYVFGQSQHFELVSLTKLDLRFLPNLIGIFEECYDPMSSCVKGSSSNYDSKAEIQLDPIKCNTFSWSNICCQTRIPLVDVDGDQPHDYSVVSELDGQQLDLGLQYITLTYLSMMTCLFVGPKNAYALKNLTSIRIKRCDKLKIAFSTSILRFLPELLYLTIEECEELEHIIEDDDDDLENKKNSNSLSSRTCFPKLQLIAVIKCNKLKFVFPFSVCKELPKLNVLLITEANELEEIFKSEDDQKVNIPNLNIVVFDMLPSLCYAQGNQFQAVKSRFVRNCQKLTLTSASTTNTSKEILDSLLFTASYDLYMNVKNLFGQLRSAETTEDFDTDSDIASVEIVENAGIEQLPSAETTEDFELPNVPDLTILPTNSEELLNEQSMDQQHSLGETDTIAKLSQLEGSTLEKIPVATMSTISGTKNEPQIQVVPPKQKIQTKQTLETEHEFVESVSDIAILPTNLEELLVKQSMDQQHSLGESDTIVKPSQVNNLEGSTWKKTTVATVSTILGTKNEPPIQVVTSKQKGVEIEETTKTNNDQVSLNEDAFMKVNSNVEEQFSRDDEITVSKVKPSPSITSPIASQFPSMASKGVPSQKVEDLSSSLLVKSELEELVSKNHLDDENLSLLTDFLVKNPSVRLKDTSLSNRYKGCAYNLLSVLLKFLETHSLLEVSGSCCSEFVELLQDARSFAFDKDWVDGVERHALFPEIQVSPDALEKLLDSKKRVTKEVEDLRLKIDILSQHVEDLKHQLTSSEAVLESIIQQEAVLSAPIGY